jgi:hypothetical protein
LQQDIRTLREQACPNPAKQNTQLFELRRQNVCLKAENERLKERINALKRIFNQDPGDNEHWLAEQSESSYI